MNTPEKKPYLRPELEAQGTIEDLTQDQLMWGAGDSMATGVLES